MNENIKRNLREYFMVDDPINNFLKFVIMVLFAALIKIGILAKDEIINGIMFNTYVWAVLMGIQTLIVIVYFGRLRGYFVLPGMLVLLWAILNNTMDLLSVASKLLALCIIVNIFILVFDILEKIKSKDKKCKKKKK